MDYCRVSTKRLPRPTKFKQYYFFRPPVTYAQSNIGAEKYPDAGILRNFDDLDCCQGYGQMKGVFRALTKDDMLKPYISDHDFRSTNVIDAGEVDNAVGYIYMFLIYDIRVF